MIFPGNGQADLDKGQIIESIVEVVEAEVGTVIVLLVPRKWHHQWKECEVIGTTDPVMVTIITAEVEVAAEVEEVEAEVVAPGVLITILHITAIITMETIVTAAGLFTFPLAIVFISDNAS